MKIKLKKKEEIQNLLNCIKNLGDNQSKEILIELLKPLVNNKINNLSIYKIYQLLTSDKESVIINSDNSYEKYIQQLPGGLPTKIEGYLNKFLLTSFILSSSIAIKKEIISLDILERSINHLIDELSLKISINGWAAIFASLKKNNLYFSSRTNLEKYIIESGVTDIFCSSLFYNKNLTTINHLLSKYPYLKFYEDIFIGSSNGFNLLNYLSPLYNRGKKLFSEKKSDFIIGVNNKFLNHSFALQRRSKNNFVKLYEDMQYDNSKFGLYSEVETGFIVLNPKAYSSLIFQENPFKEKRKNIG